MRLFLTLVITSLPVVAMAQGGGVADKNAPSNFDRTHSTIDRVMQTGNDRSPPLGNAPGERTGIGGRGGSNGDDNSQTKPATQTRNQ